MAKFVVLDHSLTRVGGHHYEHARQMLQAAEELGLQPVLATNVQFSQRDLLPAHWPVLPLFPYESRDFLADYPLDSRGAALGGASLADAPGSPGEDTEAAGRAGGWRPWHAVRRRWRACARRRRLGLFAEACAELATLAQLGPHDQVFLPTASLFDLLGVVRFLQERPQFRSLVWHALFHYGFLSGREPTYDSQQAVQRNVHRQLRYVLDHLPPHHLRLYGTTQRLAEQFHRLALTECGVLPFPVDGRALQPDPSVVPRQVLRLTCAGYLRREKGKACARSFVAALWERDLLAGHLQLVVQTNRRQARRMVPRHATIPLKFCSDLSAAPAAPILWLQHPLRREAYVELIRKSDMAVFLHEGLAYYTRCSGVLVEMLAGGVPVLVPAGTWLADQITIPISQHAERLQAHGPVLGRHTGLLAWAPDRKAAACDIDVPHGACAVVLRITWDADTAPGTFTRVSIGSRTTDTAPSMPPAEVASIVAPLPLHASVATLLPLADHLRRIRLMFSNAYNASRLTVRGVEVTFLERPREAQATYASGSVGLVYADVDQLPRLVREMHEHYAHYRATARDFAVTWRERHDARRIVAQLIGDGAHVRRAVA
jgi:hypothetical protein